MWVGDDRQQDTPAQADMAKAWEDALPEVEPIIIFAIEKLGEA
jgi:hypothetical protein